MLTDNQTTFFVNKKSLLNPDFFTKSSSFNFKTNNNVMYQRSVSSRSIQEFIICNSLLEIPETQEISTSSTPVSLSSSSASVNNSSIPIQAVSDFVNISSSTISGDKSSTAAAPSTKPQENQIKASNPVISSSVPKKETSTTTATTTTNASNTLSISQQQQQQSRWAAGSFVNSPSPTTIPQPPSLQVNSMNTTTTTTNTSNTLNSNNNSNGITKIKTLSPPQSPPPTTSSSTTKHNRPNIKQVKRQLDFQNNKMNNGDGVIESFLKCSEMMNSIAPNPQYAPPQSSMSFRKPSPPPPGLFILPTQHEHPLGLSDLDIMSSELKKILNLPTIAT